VVAIQQVLDRYALVRVDIDPLRKVTVQPVSGSSETLMKNGWTTFLVKVSNRAGTTEELDVDSPQAAMPYDFSRMQVERSVYDDQFTDVMLEHVSRPVSPGYLGRWISVQAAAAAGANRVWPAHGDLSFVPSKDRWAAVSLFHGASTPKTLTGLKLEYEVLQVYSRDEARSR